MAAAGDTALSATLASRIPFLRIDIPILLNPSSEPNLTLNLTLTLEVLRERISRGLPPCGAILVDVYSKGHYPHHLGTPDFFASVAALRSSFTLPT